ncbi:MAG TPA: SurA N-terminal domain-containing protein [Gammaproteobacteria bacterium]|nr:SurA N-terminal domain-containing protein [Gammaproteobacteria bacterium]
MFFIIGYRLVFGVHAMVIQAFRDNVPKWLTGIILALIIGPFALWGINSYFTASGDTAVATVNGTEITPQDFQQAYQNQYQRMEQMFGSAFKPEMIDEKQLREEVLQRLINQSLLDHQVVKRHYGVGNAQLIEAVRQIPAFQVDGKFSAQVYSVTLQSIGLTPTTFEQQERQSLAVGQLQTGIQNSAFITAPELKRAVAVRDEQRQFAYLTIPVQHYLKQAKIRDADIAAYYKAHSDEFMTPEQVTLSYVELDQAQLAKNAKPTEADLQAAYQQQIASFQQQEARHAQHILIAVSSGDPKADAAAKAKAEDIIKQLKAGGDFAKLAAKYSDDPGSAKNGGDLGWISRGMMVKPFEDALFDIKKIGDTVGPIRSKYGYHIIKLDGIRAGETKPFSQVRAQLAAGYAQKKAEDEYYALGDQLANLAYEHPDSLDTVSKQLNLPVQTSADVTRETGTGIAANPAIRKAAFSTGVLSQGLNSQPIQLGTNHVAVIRVKGHIPSEQKPLSAVRNEIGELLKQQQAAKQAQQSATAIVAALKAGQSPAAVARKYGAKLTAARYVGRHDSKTPGPLLVAVFAAAHPAAKSPLIGTAALDAGDQAVFILSDVKPGTTDGMDKQQAQTAGRDLMRMNAQAEFAAYLANLRQHVKVEINRNNMQQQ